MNGTHQFDISTQVLNQRVNTVITLKKRKKRKKSTEFSVALSAPKIQICAHKFDTSLLTLPNYVVEPYEQRIRK